MADANEMERRHRAITIVLRQISAEAAAEGAQFPPVVRAEDMHRESIRDGWIMGEHPVRFLRGNDHD